MIKTKARNIRIIFVFRASNRFLSQILYRSVNTCFLAYRHRNDNCFQFEEQKFNTILEWLWETYPLSNHFNMEMFTKHVFQTRIFVYYYKTKYKYFSIYFYLCGGIAIILYLILFYIYMHTSVYCYCYACFTLLPFIIIKHICVYYYGFKYLKFCHLYSCILYFFTSFPFVHTHTHILKTQNIHTRSFPPFALLSRQFKFICTPHGILSGKGLTQGIYQVVIVPYFIYLQERTKGKTACR